MDERMAWVDGFVLTMVQLGVRAENQHIIDMARELYPDHKDKDPVKLAEAEYEKWPPHDDCVRADPILTTSANRILTRG